MHLSLKLGSTSLAVFFFYAANLWMVHSLRFQMGALSRKHVPSDDSSNMHGVSTRNATWKADGDVTTGTAVADSSGKITFTFAPSCNLHVSGIAICKASWGVSWPLLARISIWAAVVLICSLVPVLNTMAKYIPTTSLSCPCGAPQRSPFRGLHGCRCVLYSVCGVCSLLHLQLPAPHSLGLASA